MRVSVSASALAVDGKGRGSEVTAQVEAAAQRTFLAPLRTKSLQRVLRAASVTGAAAKTSLFAAGEPASELSILLEGNVALLASDDAGREVALDVVCPGQPVLPWVPARATPYAFSAKTIRPARLLNIPLDDLRAELRRDGLLAELLVEVLSGRARDLLEQIEGLKLRTATQRLAHYILAQGERGPASFEVVLPYRKHVIASQLGMTPESLSRAFAVLRPLGVSITGQRVRVADAARLRQFCQEGPKTHNLGASAPP